MQPTTTETSTAEASPLADLLALTDYQQQNSRLFPGIESLRWYIRRHRPALESAGALLFIQGRVWINSRTFDAHVIEAGTKAAKRQAVVA